MKREMKRKGFTLVELLIVIVVIGILSAMMMLSSTEATTSAKVSNIVGNLRNLKTAALAFYTDSMDYFADPAHQDQPLDKDGIQAMIRSYLGSSNNTPDIGDYEVKKSKDNGGSWWVLYHITGSDAEKASIKKKLAGRAKSLGLKGDTGNVAAGLADREYTNHDYVALQVR